MEKGLTKNQILSELSKSPHGDLKEYLNLGQKATRQEPEFMAHLIAWDHKHGQIRDAKVALPVVTFTVPNFHPDFAENSLAHLALLGPRELLRAERFRRVIQAPKKAAMRRLITGYLANLEANRPKWERVAIQHRRTLKELYALAHIKPSDMADGILFKGVRPAGSLFEVVAQLKDMAPLEAAGTIMEKKIPFLIAMGALGKKAENPDLVMALIERMSPTELVTNTKMLERLGVKTNPVLRGVYEKALEKASKSKANVLKTTRAAEAIDDEDLKEKLRGVQEKQIQAFGGVEGNWLVLGDKSGSMSKSIEVAKHVAATLAKMVKGEVWLVFFDTAPRAIDVTGMALDEINKLTKHITADGGTSIGCGLLRMLDNKKEIDGIAIVSDGGENTAPRFTDVYKKYSTWAGKEVPVYLYHCDGDSPALIQDMAREKIDLQVFDLNRKTDYYSLPNLVSTMRTNRYSLIEEVMAVRLLTLSDVFKRSRKEVNSYAQ